MLHLYPLPKTHEQMAKNMKPMVILLIIFGNTVDGRNPASVTVEVGSLSHYLQGFSTIPGVCLGFLNHQQYKCFNGSTKFQNWINDIHPRKLTVDTQNINEYI